MALIIGNGQYRRFHCDECEQTNGYENLTVENNLRDLKYLLEENDFIVTAYVDLEAENFLRVIRLFKEKCQVAKNVLAFIYIGAHGFHRGTHDFAVPVDFQDIMHENQHRLTASSLGLCTLASLLENFAESNDENTDEESQKKESTKFSVVCFWDLCRDTAINFPVDSYSANCKDLQYTIIYCW
jgi:hypothetical protein